MTGQTLKLFFKKPLDENITKVLELENVAAFIDNVSSNEFTSLDIRDGGGSYGLDMSLKLKRPEVQNFKEVFLFTDTTLINCSFRAITEHATWRDFDGKPLSDVNY